MNCEKCLSKNIETINKEEDVVVMEDYCEMFGWQQEIIHRVQLTIRCVDCGHEFIEEF